MENNKILIGVQFVDFGPTNNYLIYSIELYVLRDMPLERLWDGIKYGIEKIAAEGGENRDVYKRCCEIRAKCVGKKEEPNGNIYNPNITFSSFNQAKHSGYIRQGTRPNFYQDASKYPLCDLGFITSSRVIFDATGSYVPAGQLVTDAIIDAFNAEKSKEIFFPEYNISTRILYQFDDTPVEIISPSDPPQKNNTGLITMLFPSVLSLGILLAVRIAMSSSNPAAGVAMLAMSAAMGITAVITTVNNWRRQKTEYAKQLVNWREQYQSYANKLMQTIQERQAIDSRNLRELYPDVQELIKAGPEGVYSLNYRLYSRSANDEDFLAFRIGKSDEVESMFPVKGSSKDVIFSEASFYIEKAGNGQSELHMFLREEVDSKNASKMINMCKLPDTIIDRYRYMIGAPLIYSLKDKLSLGIIDRSINEKDSYAKLFVSRMIFELCYYHSPEELQFIVFFNEKHSYEEVENAMGMYEFMPHFRGLFSDKSQFVFDEKSANMVLSSLLSLMNRRQAGEVDRIPHIVFVVFEGHGLKEHAFAEYLPKVPEKDAIGKNTLGLSFVFAAQYKEHLPAYCDDLVVFEGENMKLIPRDDMNKGKRFSYPIDRGEFRGFKAEVTRAFEFLSAVFCAQIAQNGKVPSTVDVYELFNKDNEKLEEVVKRNWGLPDARKVPSVTESLAVPLGKTDTGIAYLDLHEKGDGPHMLVAGTTGSGKSETIITFLLGLCMQYRPDELNLLLVDMKGGGFTKRIGHLPHVVGSVTDVDGDENGTGAEYMLGRFLNAMKAEIKRRKLLFNKLHVDSIDAYIKACNDIDAFIAQKKIEGEEEKLIRETAKKDRLSHLILVVDEFTELKRFSSENNDLDFMGEITTIARVGRSLGFHIILISQNIEGAITEDIRVNSRARLCLKVATRQASKDMIGTELAASPNMPGNGRAYLLVGTGSKFEYFQSGYSGFNVSNKNSVPVEITLASKYGAYRSFYRSDKDNDKLRRQREEQKKSGKVKTQLDAMTEAICAVYDSVRAQNPEDETKLPHMVFRAPLPTRIAMDASGKVVPVAAEKGEK